MYEGKRIAKGDTIFVFASENEGGSDRERLRRFFSDFFDQSVWTRLLSGVPINLARRPTDLQ
jgi:hypothetical protein